jgi:hypothetical protein
MSSDCSSEGRPQRRTAASSRARYSAYAAGPAVVIGTITSSGIGFAKISYICGVMSSSSMPNMTGKTSGASSSSP